MYLKTIAYNHILYVEIVLKLKPYKNYSRMGNIKGFYGGISVKVKKI